MTINTPILFVLMTPDPSQKASHIASAPLVILSRNGNLHFMTSSRTLETQRRRLALSERTGPPYRIGKLCCGTFAKVDPQKATSRSVVLLLTFQVPFFNNLAVKRRFGDFYAPRGFFRAFVVSRTFGATGALTRAAVPTARHEVRDA
jgi:hypothetical protein